MTFEVPRNLSVFVSTYTVGRIVFSVYILYSRYRWGYYLKSIEVSLVLHAQFKTDIEKMEKVERKSSCIFVRMEKRECRTRSEERTF